MADVFISYAREDEPRIGVLVRALESQGLSVWWDRQIPAGRTWREHIGAALGAARCVVVAWSTHSIGSHFVAEEADEGKQRQILVPVLIDPVLPPLGFRSIHAADLRDLSAAAAPPRGLDGLVGAIRAVIAAAPAAGPAAAVAPPGADAASAPRRPVMWLAAAALLVAVATLAYLATRGDSTAGAPVPLGEVLKADLPHQASPVPATAPAAVPATASARVLEAWRNDDGGLGLRVEVTHHGAAPLTLDGARDFGLVGSAPDLAQPAESRPLFETLQRDEPVVFTLRFAGSTGAVALRVTLPGLAPHDVPLPARR